jgi:signal transduction histidine kinase/ligand-binding sensor domain-containing protein
MFSGRVFEPLLLILLFGIGSDCVDATQAEAQSVVSYGLKRLTTQDGLPQNTVRCLLQSHDGYLWIGTSAGVAKYDGLRFTVYHHDFLSSEGVDARVWDLEEDGKGRIWVRTDNNLACFEQGQWTTFPVQGPPLNGPIHSARASREGGIWLMAEGLKRFQFGGVTDSFGTPDGCPSSLGHVIGEDMDGGLWVSFGNEHEKPNLWRLDLKTGTYSGLDSLSLSLSERPDVVIPARSGGLWLCSSVEFVREQTNHLARYKAPSLLASHRIAHIREDKLGGLWFLCQGVPQVFQFRAGAGFQIDVPELPSNDLRCVLPGQDGVVWIGTGDQGLVELRPQPLSSLLTTNSAGDKLEVFSISPGAGGRLWFGTSEGLFRLQDGVFTRFTNSWLNPRLRFENSVRSVLEDRAGMVWFGINDEGLKTLRQGQFATESAAAFGTSNRWTVSTLLEDRAGNLWIGSDLGLLRRTTDGQFTLISDKFNFQRKRVNGAKEAPDGAIWVGTDGAGVYKLINGSAIQFTTRDGLSSDFADPLCIEPDGTVWIGTPKGLDQCRGSGKVRTIKTKQGLMENELFSLTDDSQGFYWATCNRGVCRIPKAELHAVADGVTAHLSCVTFGEADGLASSECNGECQPNATRRADGTLWFSTTRGCSTIDPKNLVPIEVPPPAVIEEVLVDDQLIFKDGALTPAAREFGQATKPRLPAGRGRVLEIRYTANSFLNPKGVVFAHQLTPHDRSWRDAGNRRAAFYTNLKPAEYKFDVKARNDLGLWSPTVASFSFSVIPRFWQTTTFYLAVGLTVIGLAAAMQAYRLRWQQRLLKIQQQQALANERARIARDLHDDLGTALTGLALELDVAGRDARTGAPLTDRLGETAKRARDLAERMREVVWTINPRCDTVLSLATFLEQQAGQFLNSDGLRVRLNFPAEIPVSPVGAEARHQLALSVREAFNNIVRHAHATEVNLNLKLTDDYLMVEVVDNGCGFRVTETNGNGLLNMRGRMHQIGGSFDCFSMPGHGTTITFRIPVASRDTRSSSKQHG